ncbi:Cleavage/polyadenylation specificity factor, A subunit, partial [Mycena rebaudengoi]
FATTIVNIHTQSSRIVVGDMQNSLIFLTYQTTENRLVVVADDPQSRWTTCSTMVDYYTVVAGDRFGNIFVNRLDPQISELVDQDPTVCSSMGPPRLIHPPPPPSPVPASCAKHPSSTGRHLKPRCLHFHLGDLITSIHKVSLVAAAKEVLLYTGLHGTIGIRRH